MRVANSLDELKKIIKDDMLVSVATDVVDKVQDRMIRHIVYDVYEVYKPKAYKRRYILAGKDVPPYNPFDDTDNTGLLDRDNIVATITDRYSNKVIVTVENYTLGSKYYYLNGRQISRNAGKPIANVIETGIGYDVLGWAYYGVPRPFIQNTFDDLSRTEDYAKAFVKSMRAKGYDFK